MALTIGVTCSRADVVQATVVLPPATGAYALGGLCEIALGRCVENAMVSDFSVITDAEKSGNELVVTGATYSANVFTDAGGSPGAFLGHLSLSGTADFTYVGRNPSVNPLGLFTTDLTNFDFSGMLNGKTFEVKQNPGSASTGSTTILESTFVPPIEYTVSSSLDVSGEFSFNGSPFMTTPGRMTTLTTAIPEPASGALLGSLLLLWIASRRRRVQ
jgi:hypothetical protein